MLIALVVTKMTLKEIAAYFNVVTTLILLFRSCEGCYGNAGYFSWSTGSRDPICCPTKCRTKDSVDRCCSCEAKPCWEIRKSGLSNFACPETLGRLHVEKTSVFGDAVLRTNDNATVFKLDASNSELNAIPSNICDWTSSLVTLDLSHNRLTDVSSLSCLRSLGTIHLDYNMIVYLSNKTFSSMKNLHTLTMRHNPRLMRLEPNLLNIGEQNICNVDFSFNNFDSVDITAILRPGPFCNATFNDGFVGKITNDLNYILNALHGPGTVNLERTGITQMINFSSLGIDYSEIGNSFAGQLVTDAASFACDCNIYPLVSQAKHFERYWLNKANEKEYNFICNNPEQMKGINLLEVVQKGDFHDLVCELQNCPLFCTCLDIPSENKVLVNCSNKDLYDFPNEMPVGYWNNKNIDLRLDGNYITDIPSMNYFNRIVRIDLTGNNIHSIDPRVITSLDDSLVQTDGFVIVDQSLDTLVSEFQYKDPAFFVFGNNSIKCDCTNLWIGDWLRIHNANGRLLCQTEHGIVAAETVSSKSLDCIIKVMPITQTVVPLSVLLTLVLAGICTAWYFKYELVLLLRKLRKNTSINPDLEIDVFISVCESNVEAFMFVQSHVLPVLRQSDYSVFVPFNEITLGDREVGMLEGVKKSRNFVIVLCGGYGEDYNTLSEFAAIWEWYKMDKTREIIVIKFDHIEGKICNKKLRAVQRVSPSVSFKDREGTMMGRLKKLVGPSKRNSEASSDGDNWLHVHGEQVMTTLSEIEDANENNPSVFARLSEPKLSTCNCKYRRCYIHESAI